ncbi:hypothetical protein SARC_09477 [Sphaeroforma arctica JP610]|uniref:Uncharacterized protein n=1 Tax=Sphaeroforma arctica JP610 TaxID=667725 RepID=A0A0L0FNR7_9EUKA|nr:hypothetical protein SARC_09477 [Sphaeroforma arctica JP610]KNC78076.1 hypothetical protein SARC_09477 [Sphaeroforma arctica JP610]|eukprot:XP_014151978.1 hypothetical protein SARC_09477 [Sphaeroforma arctica JP610]
MEIADVNHDQKQPEPDDNGIRARRRPLSQRREQAEDIFDEIEQQGYASFEEGPLSLVALRLVMTEISTAGSIDIINKCTEKSVDRG